jgi:hypothetical protein
VNAHFKNMENKPIIIDNFQKGIADSPLLGFGKMLNVDISTRPGTAMINYSAVKTSSTNVTGTPNWMVKDADTGIVYAFTSDNKLHKNASSWAVKAGNTTSSGNGNGMVIWNGYILTFRSGQTDAFNISGESWTNGFQAITTDTSWHPSLVGQDDILYIGSQNVIQTFTEVGAFNPADSGTWTFGTTALDLPTGYKINCLAELGDKLYAGTQFGTGVYGGRADIFPWDRTSSSFELPIRLPEDGIHQMLTVGNLLYVVAGRNHNIYVTNDSSFELVYKQRLIDNRGGAYLNPKPGAIIFHKGRLFTGVSGSGDATNPYGVYSLDTKTGVWNFENQLSSGNTDGDVIIGALCSETDDIFHVGWNYNSASWGIDQVGATVYNTAYETLLESTLYKVGSKYNKRTFQYIEFELADAMVSTDGVRLSYRENLGDDWTTIGTTTYASDGALKSQRFSFGQSLESVQIRAELKGTSTMCLKSIILS